MGDTSRWRLADLLVVKLEPAFGPSPADHYQNFPQGRRHNLSDACPPDGMMYSETSSLTLCFYYFFQAL